MKERADRGRLPPGCGSVRGGTGYPWKEWGQSVTAPQPSARVVCRDPVASPLLWGRHWPSPRVCMSFRAKALAVPTPGDCSVHRVQL